VNIPLFPLNTVLFPQGLLPLRVFEIRYTDMVRDCLRTGTPFGVVNIVRGSDTQTPDDTDASADTSAGAEPSDIEQRPEHHVIGTLATVVDFDMVEPAVLMIAAQGGQRFRVLSTNAQANGLIRAQVELIAPDAPTAIAQPQAKTGILLEQIIKELEKQQKQADEAGHKTFCFPIAKPYLLDDAGWVANRFSELMPLGRNDRQALLEQPQAHARLEWITDYLSSKDVI
jgi:Lon protease-like protein